jgi:protein-S-isoprenylcysteine O-methyltransferase Ste14
MRSTLRSALPLLLTVTGFVVMGALVVRRIIASGGAIAFIAAAIVYAAWLAWESRVSARELAKSAVDHDRATMELAALAKYALLFTAVSPNDAPRPIACAVGLALMVFGIAVRAAAIARLGAHYSHRIRVPGAIVSSGPYAVIRHPAYLGTLLAHTGLALVFLSAWSIGALVLLWYPAVIVRTVIEDRCLRAHPDYAAYASRVKSALIAKVI